MELLAKHISAYVFYRGSQNHPRFPEGGLYPIINHRIDYVYRNYLYNILDIVPENYKHE